MTVYDIGEPESIQVYSPFAIVDRLLPKSRSTLSHRDYLATDPSFCLRKARRCTGQRLFVDSLEHGPVRIGSAVRALEEEDVWVVSHTLLRAKV